MSRLTLFDMLTLPIYCNCVTMLDRVNYFCHGIAIFCSGKSTLSFHMMLEPFELHLTRLTLLCWDILLLPVQM